MSTGYESCAGCADPVIRGDTARMDLFCAWCVEAAEEMGIDLDSGDVSANDLAKLAGMREANIG